MDGIITAPSGILDGVWVISTKPNYSLRENTVVLLNGYWVTQTMGKRAETLRVSIATTYEAWKTLNNLAETKEEITVEYRETKKGFIVGMPEFDEAVPFDEEPYYYMEIDLAVVENVST